MTAILMMILMTILMIQKFRAGPGFRSQTGPGSGPGPGSGLKKPGLEISGLDPGSENRDPIPDQNIQILTKMSRINSLIKYMKFRNYNYLISF